MGTNLSRLTATVVAGLLALASEYRSAGAEPPIGQPAPALVVTELDGQTFDLVHPSGIEGLIILARGPRYSARGFPA